jgi:hypothetical protein
MEPLTVPPDQTIGRVESHLKLLQMFVLNFVSQSNSVLVATPITIGGCRFDTVLRLF